jgi:hypothetical protein
MQSFRVEGCSSPANPVEQHGCGGRFHYEVSRFPHPPLGSGHHKLWVLTSSIGPPPSRLFQETQEFQRRLVRTKPRDLKTSRSADHSPVGSRPMPYFARPVVTGADVTVPAVAAPLPRPERS